MKTPQEWMEEMEAECASTGETIPCPINPYLIRAIQRDAIESKTFVADLEDNINHYREKWHEARKHLRAANKGAERNAIALQLAASRIYSMNDPLEKKLWQWLSFSDEDMRLRMGEMNAQEIRNCRALLRAVLDTSKLSKHTN